MLAELRRDPSLVVGDNEPYSARDPYEYTLTAHAQPRALPHCSLEVRQDLIATPASAQDWGRRLASPIRAAVAAALRCRQGS
jgi:predicted N-formylglutamate amidohydrolase